MFSKFLTWVKGVIDKMIGRSTVQKALGVETAISSAMAQEIEKWVAIFKNESPWLSDTVKSLSLGSTIASEMSRMVTIEMKSEVTGSTRADYLNEQYEKVIDDIRKNLEYALAKGGMAIKPYVSDGIIAIDYVHADSFFPVKFNANGEVTAAVFVEQLTKGKFTYTRLEYHEYANRKEYISNMAFMSISSSELGRRTDLTSVEEWATLEPEITITGIDKPLFAYFKVPFANTIDESSPIGVSIYSRAVGLIEEADRQYSRFLWEFESGERALYVDVTAFKKDSNGNPILPNKRLYKTMDSGTEGFYNDYTPTLREENLLRGLDSILMKIEDSCGLARGTLSNPQTEARTATELKILRQRSYATVLDIQKALKKTLEHLVYAMDVQATLYKLAPQGKYEMTFDFDDSIVSDRDKQFAELQMLETMGVITKEKLYAWYFGTTEEEAKANIPESVIPVGGVI